VLQHAATCMLTNKSIQELTAAQQHDGKHHMTHT
jgi:hypothetical protein